MSSPFATGVNYSLSLDGPLARVRIWRRPDLDPTTSANAASEVFGHLVALVSPTSDRRAPDRVKGIVFDIREAPVVAGPKTAERLGELFTVLERRKARIAVVILQDQPMQVLQFRRLISGHAPTQGRVVSSTIEAETWLSATT